MWCHSMFTSIWHYTSIFSLDGLRQTWELWQTDQKYLESFEMWRCRKIEKISRTDRVENEEELYRSKKKRIILYTLKRRKANWIGEILRWNFLLKHVIEGNIEGTGTRGRQRKQILDDLEKKKDNGIWRGQGMWVQWGALALPFLQWKSNTYHIIWTCVCSLRLCSMQSACAILSSVACPALQCFFFHIILQRERFFVQNHWIWNVCFDILYNFCREEMSEIWSEKYTDLHVKYPVF